MLVGLGRIQDPADRGQLCAQAHNLCLFRVHHVSQQFLHALVHDALRQHLQLEQLANEFDQTETLAFRFLRSVVLVPVQHNFTAFFARLIGHLDSLVFQCLSYCSRSGSFLCHPTTLKVLFAPFEQVFAEQLTTCDGFALEIPDPIVLHLWANTLHHLAAKSGVHLGPPRLVGGLLKHQIDDLEECSAVLFFFRFVGSHDDLVRDRVEFFHCQLVQQTLDLAVDDFGLVEIAECNRFPDPSVGRNLQGRGRVQCWLLT